MSVVTNLILNLGHEDKIDEINEWLVERYGAGFGEMIDHSKCERCVGGNRNMEPDIYIAAFNYFRLHEFIEFLVSIKWQDIGHIQLLSMDDEALHFQSITAKSTEIIPWV